MVVVVVEEVRRQPSIQLGTQLELDVCYELESCQLSQEGQWVDVVSGSPLTWKNWAKNQPASLSEDQDCAVINTDDKRNTEISSVRDHLTTNYLYVHLGLQQMVKGKRNEN